MHLFPQIAKSAKERGMLRYEFVGAERLYEEAFRKLLWPEFRDWLPYGFDAEMHHVLAEWEDSQLVGLCVVDKHPFSTSAVLQSLAGVDLAALLSRMENHLKIILLSAEWPRLSPLERLFGCDGWSKPEKRFETYYFYMPQFNPTWFSDHLPLPEGYSIIPWEAMSIEEQAATERWANQDSYLLSDHTESKPREAINSLILRYKDTIAGWIETHRLNEQMIRYTSFFLFPEHRHQGVAIPLLCESLQRHIDSPATIAVFSVNLKDTTPTWVNFVRKKLAPHAYHHGETLVSFKRYNLL